jgi:ABC-type transporter MlaC component
MIAAGAFAADAKRPENAREKAAHAVVDSALQELLALFADADLAADQRRASTEKLIRERFDTRAAAHRALGSRKLPEADDASFTCEYDSYLSRYISDRLDGYKQEQIEIVAARETRSKKFVVVRTRVVGGEFDGVFVDFRMVESGAGWRAVDVTFDGTSVVKSHGAQFREVLDADGAERLLQILKEKNGSNSSC